MIYIEICLQRVRYTPLKEHPLNSEFRQPLRVTGIRSSSRVLRRNRLGGGNHMSHTAYGVTSSHSLSAASSKAAQDLLVNLQYVSLNEFFLHCSLIRKFFAHLISWLEPSQIQTGGPYFWPLPTSPLRSAPETAMCFSMLGLCCA